MTAIQTIDLCKSYAGKPAVDRLNLEIPQGELFALLGVNGAGKTTTIRMLSCLTRPTSGEALVLGQSAVTQPMQVKRMLNISPQETAVAPNLSVRENLELICGLYGQRRKQAKAAAAQMLERMGLAPVAASRAKTLSGGWQRRLSIAMALITEPQVLFLDEPTLGLDVLARRELWKLIEGLKGRVTVLLTTHYLEEAEALADHVGIMAHGRLCAAGTPAQLVARTGAASFEDAFIALAGEGGEAV